MSEEEAQCIMSLPLDGYCIICGLTFFMKQPWEVNFQRFLLFLHIPMVIVVSELEVLNHLL